MSIGFNKYFDRGAYHWEAYFGDSKEVNDTWYREVVDKTLPLFPNKGTLLDIGCGDGLIAGLLSKKGLEVTGFDGEEVSIILAQEKCVGEYACKRFFPEAIETVNINEDFDYMLACDFIEHIQDPQPLVKLFTEHCKNYMILSTDLPHFGLRRHDYHRYSVDDLKKLFAPYKVEMMFETDFIYAVKITK